MMEQRSNQSQTQAPPDDPTERILQERAQLLARLPKAETDANNFVEVVTFHTGGEYFGVTARFVFETQPLHSLHWSRVPCAPAFIVGLINLRGHLYSIMDLSRFLGSPEHAPTESAHVLLVRGGNCEDGAEMELTLLADDMPQLQSIPVSALYPPPPTVSAQLQDYIRGISNEMLMVLDLEHLLSDPRIIVHEEI